MKKARTDAPKIGCLRFELLSRWIRKNTPYISGVFLKKIYPVQREECGPWLFLKQQHSTEAVMNDTWRTKVLVLVASQVATIAFTSLPASAQGRNFDNVCVKAYREQFNCENGKNAAYARETSIQREARFCDKVTSNENHYVEKSLKSGTSVAAYWKSTRGRQELNDVKQFCSLRQIDKMRDYFCQAYSPRCAPVLARIDRKNGACPGGGRECLDEAKRQERDAIRALEQQKQEFERNLAASKESLQALLERAALYLDSKTEAFRDLPDSTSELALDRRAFEDTLNATSRDGGFVAMAEASSRTDDPGLQGLLWLSAAARGLQETSEAGIADATQAGSELTGLEAITADREKRMESVYLSTITKEGPQAVYPIHATSPEFGSSALQAADIHWKQAAKNTEAEDKPGKSSSSEITAAGAAPAGNARYPEKAKPSLRELLAQKLKEGSKSGGTPEGAAAHLASPELILANAKGSSSDTGKVDGMSGLTPDPGASRGLASESTADENTGSESLTLFQRVNRMHRQVLAEGRVILSPAGIKVAAGR